MIQKYSSTETDHHHFLHNFRELRNFLVLDIVLRNGKRAGVLADMTLCDVAVSKLTYLNDALKTDLNILCVLNKALTQVAILQGVNIPYLNSQDMERQPIVDGMKTLSVALHKTSGTYGPAHITLHQEVLPLLSTFIAMRQQCDYNEAELRCDRGREMVFVTSSQFLSSSSSDVNR